MMVLKSILVLNTGSSSVKASLLTTPYPDHEKPEKSLSRDQPLRLITAHAERLFSDESTIHITIALTAVDQFLQILGENGHCTKLHRADSLSLTSRSSSNYSKIEDSNDTDKSKPLPNDRVKTIQMKEPNLSHKTAIQQILDAIISHNDKLLSSVIAIGHRVVHGGTKLSRSVVIDENVITAIESVSHLAPLHNPANLQGIQVTRELFPSNIPNIAVFDTAFHSTIPKYAYSYPLPDEYTQHKIRKYGFHGTSVKYVSQIACQMYRGMNLHKGKSTSTNCMKIIVCHLGNGASVTAVVDGKSVDTTMEFTPLSGIMMGTRSGSVDPAIVPFASEVMNKSTQDVINDLNKKSGLLGVSGFSNDMRPIIDAASNGNEQAGLAIEMFVYILAKHIGAMAIACGGTVDALVFTAGIGENSSYIRKLTVEKLGGLLGPIDLDDDMNLENGISNNGIISKQHGSDGKEGPVVMVVHTDEEISISQDCIECLNLLKG